MSPEFELALGLTMHSEVAGARPVPKSDLFQALKVSFGSPQNSELKAR
jgi:hypothetical protein